MSHQQQSNAFQAAFFPQRNQFFPLTVGLAMLGPVFPIGMAYAQPRPITAASFPVPASLRNLADSSPASRDLQPILYPFASVSGSHHRGQGSTPPVSIVVVQTAPVPVVAEPSTALASVTTRRQPSPSRQMAVIDVPPPAAAAPRPIPIAPRPSPHTRRPVVSLRPQPLTVPTTGLSELSGPTPATSRRSIGSDNLLPVPPEKIPLGRGGSDIRITLVPPDVTLTAASLPSSVWSGPSYRVVVPTVNSAQQQQVKAIVPEAFETLLQGQPSMQVGVFRERSRAEAWQLRLQQQGLPAQIAPLE